MPTGGKFMIELDVHIERVARRLFGEPNRALSKRHQLRFGTNGSLAVDIAGRNRGLWYDYENKIGGHTRQMLLDRGNCRDDADIAEWFKRELGLDVNPDKQHVVKTYDYVDERGALLFQVLRWGPKKTFSQQQPGSGKGGIKRDQDGKPTMQGARYVPYRLNELAAARTRANGKPWRVFVVEGEKDVDGLVSRWGLTATCNAGGAGKWRGEYGQYFVGAEVVIIPDNDDAGRKHAVTVAARLSPFAAVIKIVELGGLSEKGDISDWIDAGGSQSDLETLIECTAEQAKTEPPGGSEFAGLIIRRLSKFERRPLSWLWRGRIARGKLTLIAGHPGLGKSQAALSIAAVVSTGGLWPEGVRAAERGNVIILSAEDDPEDTLGPRFDAAGGDSDKVHIIEMVRIYGDDWKVEERGFSLREDIARLATAIEEIGNVTLIVIDPITAYLGDEVDSHNMADVRAVLHPLAEMAAKHMVAVLAITHLRKNTDGDAVLLVTGSLAFVAASRATFFVMRDQDNKNRRLFLTAKNNLAIDTTGLAYAIESFTLPQGIATSRVVWESATIARTADDELARQRAGKDQSTREMEIRWLKELLADGPIEVETIKLAVKAAGLAWGTVRRAAKDVGIITSKTGGSGAPWEWMLP
jgi:putative DNA primase/helicase